MSLGDKRPLYLLPFDHRQSYVTGMFDFTPPLTASGHDIVAGNKQVIYEGFRQALGEGVLTPRAGILVTRNSARAFFAMPSSITT